MKKIILFFLFFIGNLSHAMMSVDDINSELPVRFEQNMPEYFTVCADCVSKKNFLDGANALLNGIGRFQNFFNSDFLNNNDSRHNVKQKLELHFDRVCKAYDDDGFYDKKHPVSAFVRATLLGAFYYEYNEMLEKIANVLRLASSLNDPNGKPVFFEITDDKFVLKNETLGWQ